MKTLREALEQLVREVDYCLAHIGCTLLLRDAMAEARETMECGDVFDDISTEVRREYTFPGGDKVAIEQPTRLHVSASGGHRVLDASGNSHYIPKGWIHLSWETLPGKPKFVR